MNNNETATIKTKNTTYNCPIIIDNLGNKGLDIRNLRSDTGIITYDPGFANTASCTSRICTVDGEKGTLHYRGYPIDQLVEKCDFVEVAHLLVKGELPNCKERKLYMELLNRHSLLDYDMQNFFRTYPKKAHPMAILAAMVASLSAFYPEIEDMDPEENIDLTVSRLLSKMRTIVAFTYRHARGEEFVNPSYKYTYCENFLHMLFDSPVVPFEANPIHVKALNQLLILHADHAQNCSTTAVRLVGSSDANLYSSVTAGVCALWGSKHGGANQAVLEMLQEIDQNNIPIKNIIEKIKDKKNPCVLYGFGHRVYKTIDPRAVIARKMCHEVLADGNNKGDERLLQIAMELEEVALKDEYFIERKLYPNVDFYTGIIFHALGIPTDFFTTLFAMGRLPGWIAHYLEWKHDPYQKISRPRQLYFGLKDRKVLNLKDRV